MGNPEKNKFEQWPEPDVYSINAGVDPGYTNGDKTAVVIYTRCSKGTHVIVPIESYIPIMDGLLARQLPRWGRRERIVYYGRRFVSRVPAIKRWLKFNKYEGLLFGVSVSARPTYQTSPSFDFGISMGHAYVPKERTQYKTGTIWVSVDPASSGGQETLTIWDGGYAVNTKEHTSQGSTQTIEWITGMAIIDKNIDILVNVIGVGRIVHEHLLKLGYNSIQTNPAKEINQHG